MRMRGLQNLFTGALSERLDNKKLVFGYTTVWTDDESTSKWMDQSKPPELSESRGSCSIRSSA